MISVTRYFLVFIVFVNCIFITNGQSEPIQVISPKKLKKLLLEEFKDYSRIVGGRLRIQYDAMTFTEHDNHAIASPRSDENTIVCAEYFLNTYEVTNEGI